MTADKPSPFVPKLRFSEFIGQELHDVRLGEVTEESMARNGSRLPPASVMGVRKEDGIVPMEERLVATDISRYKLVRSNWFAYNPMRLNIGSIARWQGDSVVLVSPDYVVFRCLEQSTPAALHPEYLDHFRSSSQWDAFVNEAGDGGVRVRIYYRDISQLRLIVPDVVEQQKIADCLGALDDLIAAEGRKLEALRQHKQGLMQQLFPQPGETQPLLRFTEFRDAPDWEQAALGTLLDRPPEYGVNAAAVPFSEDLPAYIRITDIDDDGRFVPAPRVSVDIEPSDDQFLQPGDIVLARTGASVGKSYRYRVEDGRLVFAGFLIRVRPNLDRLVPEFLSAYLSTWSYWDWVRLTSARSGQPGINGSEYASMPLTMPTDATSLPEQHKIADCFAVLDEGIAAQRQRLRALKCHKNGLLQQLFPTPKAT